jgi:hypothetical protein
MPPSSGAVAQLGERCVRNAQVSGSIPLGSTVFLRFGHPNPNLLPRGRGGLRLTAARSSLGLGTPTQTCFRGGARGPAQQEVFAVWVWAPQPKPASAGVRGAPPNRRSLPFGFGHANPNLAAAGVRGAWGADVFSPAWLARQGAACQPGAVSCFPFYFRGGGVFRRCWVWVTWWDGGPVRARVPGWGWGWRVSTRGAGAAELWSALGLCCQAWPTTRVVKAIGEVPART